MNVRQKLGYMLIGCLFTIAGYILALLGGSVAGAGNTGKSGANITGAKYRGSIGFYSKDRREVVLIVATENGNGVIQTYKGVWHTH